MSKEDSFYFEKRINEIYPKIVCPWSWIALPESVQLRGVGESSLSDASTCSNETQQEIIFVSLKNQFLEMLTDIWYFFFSIAFFVSHCCYSLVILWIAVALRVL